MNWIQQQDGKVRQFLATPIHAGKRHALIAKALYQRFPARGPGSALLPQHYPQAELQAIVDDTLDAARDAHFAQAGN